MSSTLSSRYVVACVVVFAVFVSALGATATAASDGADDGATLERTGEPEPLVVGDTSQAVSNLTVSADRTAQSSETVTLHLDLDAVVDRGVDAAAVSASVEGVHNGTVTDVTHLHSANRTRIAVEINPDDPQYPVRVDAVRLADLDTDDARRTAGLSYDIAVTDGGTSLDEIDGWRSTAEFTLVDGSIELRDQATFSTRVGSDTPTESSVTVSNLSGNADSTLFITDKNGYIYDITGVPVEAFGSEQRLVPEFFP